MKSGSARGGADRDFASLAALGADCSWEQDADFRFLSLRGASGLAQGIAGSAVGRRPWELPGFRPAEGDWSAHIETLRRREAFRDLEARLSLSDGSERVLFVSGEPVLDAAGGFCGYRGVMRDVTASRRREDLLASSARILERVASGDPLGSVLDTLARDMESLSPRLACAVLLRDEDGLHLRHAAAPSLPQEFVHLFDGIEIGPRRSACGTAAHHGETVLVPDIATDPLWEEFRREALRHGLRACWSAPILDPHRRVLGVFNLFCREPRFPTAPELQLVAHATHLASIAVERHRAQRAVVLSEARLRRVLDTVPRLAVQGYDRRGKVSYWNAANEGLFGFSADEAIGRNLVDLVIPPEIRAKVRQDIAHSAASGVAPPPAELWLLRRDGSRVPVLSSHVVVDLPGREPELFCLHFDLGPLKEVERRQRELSETLERRVVERTAELEAALQEIESFSYSVSHDLRGPLRAINGFASVLYEVDGARLSAEGRDALSRVMQGATRMGEVIDDLLRLSRVSRQGLHLAELDLGALVRAVLDELRGAYPAATVTVGTLPWVIGDEALLRIAFTNLLDNALKFSSREPQPRVEVEAEPGAREVDVWVRDNGIGFDMQYAGKLFGVFQRMNPEAGFPGTGVGLAIVKRIVDRHGGRLSVDARPGQGASFHVALPGVGSGGT